MKKVTFHTIGCRLNQSETAVLVDRFQRLGYEQVKFGEPTDLLVLNTCSVTEGAEVDCRRAVRRTLRQSPQAFVAVTGCYAQTGVQALQAIPGVDLVLGNQFKMNLPDYVRPEALTGKSASPAVVHSGTIDRDDFEQEGVGEYSTTRANLKIQDGCNFMCSFCLIPFARGRERSRQIDDAIREAEQLVARGHKEVVLTGVNVGQFASGSSGIIDLLQRLELIQGLARIRISSIEPTTIPEALLEYMASSSKLCRFLHVPLQSGDNGILQAMNRRYTVKDYSDWVHHAAQKIPDVCIGTDLMVGFPGESEEQFANTRAVVVDLPLAYFHVFSYSARPGTAATRLENTVASKTIKSRSKNLSELSREKRAEFYHRFVDQRVSVLFESAEGPGWWSGLTDNFIRVRVPSTTVSANEIHAVHLTGTIGEAALGHIVRDQNHIISKDVIPMVHNKGLASVSVPRKSIQVGQ
ncbi:tRNA (N(6)-L-threonylcarbamoyladenosine(37)-C(2))-methylthiotransferase MtaB [Candidatus Nitronereus thalassa]|uniref:tRNA (N(6)-L-threonylcarbamoyladenosine(37)-C(2))-methylthiotransferase MtaB n=1 Tax=Candidatus Nitronereus thalassa TaxID=3020898 RepID=A0ABU3KAJ6_9BACT|nr:tRNA (N(6)-L-threonylcarbamoyladenosine(37)-C(2))-methylthiotransferase MtaB [Candidatus Nitronereus thalassa]MDT7043440.1 tRNA (N(6)-L-threonylcarbamoyladenosine(37)-C(2))-methylthiotransferase MtaB [Candidatus Nitronereus thalassa]